MYKRAKRGKYAQTVVVHLLVSSRLKLAILVEPFSAWLVSLVDFDAQPGGDIKRLQSLDQFKLRRKNLPIIAK